MLTSGTFRPVTELFGLLHLDSQSSDFRYRVNVLKLCNQLRSVGNASHIFIIIIHCIFCDDRHKHSSPKVGLLRKIAIFENKTIINF